MKEGMKLKSSIWNKYQLMSLTSRHALPNVEEKS